MGAKLKVYGFPLEIDGKQYRAIAGAHSVAEVYRKLLANHLTHYRPGYRPGFLKGWITETGNVKEIKMAGNGSVWAVPSDQAHLSDAKWRKLAKA